MTLLIILSIILLLLTILDITSTRAALSLGGHETMTLPRVLIQRTGFRGLTIVKLTIVLFFSTICFYYYLHNHCVASIVIATIADCYTLLVVIHNARAIRRLSQNLASSS